MIFLSQQSDAKADWSGASYSGISVVGTSYNIFGWILSGVIEIKQIASETLEGGREGRG